MTSESAPAQKHLYLVDGSSYIFRAYHRLPPLTNIRGEPVGAVYGYTTMLWKLIDALDKADGPTHLAVILDASGKSFRNDLYDLYKANRPEPPEDLKPQFPMIRDATRAFSVPCIELEGFEADDLIASYTKAARAQGFDVTIVSSDKDLMQLIEPHVDMLDTMKNVRMGREAVEEKFGVAPDKVGDVLALMGDSVDNVPGIPGIGPKTATKLMVEYGSLENVLDAAPGMKPSKMRDNLIQHRDMAELSRKLVELDSNIDPLPMSLDQLDLDGIPPEPLQAFLEHHGFKSLLSKLGGPQSSGSSMANREFNAAIAGQSSVQKPAVGAGAPSAALPELPPIDRNLYELVTTKGALEKWAVEAKHLGVVAFDTETSGLDATSAALVGISLSTGPGKACYIPLDHKSGDDMFAERPVQLSMDDARAVLKPMFEDETILKLAHNGKYDLSILIRHGFGVVAPLDDSIVMSFDLDSGQHNHGMDDLSKLYLDHICIPYSDVAGSGKKQILFSEVPLDKALAYAAEDAEVTWRLWRLFKHRLPQEGGTRIYEMVDRPLVPVIARMERAGIMVDAAYLKKLSGEFAAEALRLEGEIHELAGQPFTIGSPKQLGEILFDKMGLKGGRKGKSGVYSTDVTELERLAKDGVPIANKILEWRQLTKLKSTYTDALVDQINPETGRVHTSYSLTGAQTGRLSSNDPNLQNIPVRTEVGRQLRDAFIAAPGNVLLSADYSQIELRLAADMADVPALKQAFLDGEDIHAATAQELFGEVNRDTRGRAKTINFSILYGISRWGLAGRLEITPDEAQDMINRYFERFPGISTYIATTLENARDKGYTETLFGRKTHFPRLNAPNQNERAGSERAAINAPIQGTSADIIKRAMVRMEPALAAAGLDKVKMLLQVHDELIFELPEVDVEAASKVIREVMENAASPAVKLEVPLAVDIGTGPSWGAAH